MTDEIIELTELAKWWPFGEFLVEYDVLDRFQLFRALQMQDREPGMRLGQCAAALGFIPHAAIEQLHVRFIELEHLEYFPTEAFSREPDIEIVIG
jgi:hypothetical protein